MSRVQLALNVDDVDAAVGFYSALFGMAPAKRRPGYANFAVESPPLKLVLIENPGQGGSLNHLGVEVGSTDEVVAATARLGGAGLATEVEEGSTCCYARQDKVWVSGPGAESWEIYTVLADAGTEYEGSRVADLTSAVAAGDLLGTGPSATPDGGETGSHACCAS
ncbi:MAG: ArsI/CadI family heavy metal resistance metalloenzyme [Actinomycetes bacterium]